MKKLLSLAMLLILLLTFTSCSGKDEVKNDSSAAAPATSAPTGDETETAADNIETAEAAIEPTAAPAPEKYIFEDYTYILLPDGTAEIVNYSGDTEEIVIPSDFNGIPVTSIGDDAFRDCSSLTSVSIPDSVTYIGDTAFEYCRLTSVTIPDSVTSMGVNPFIRCFVLTDIIVSPEHPVFTTIDGVLFNKSEKKLICYP